MKSVSVTLADDWEVVATSEYEALKARVKELEAAIRHITDGSEISWTASIPYSSMPDASNPTLKRD